MATDPRASLDTLHNAFSEALKSNDEAALGACYTETAVVLPPGRPMISGRRDVVAFWKQANRIQDIRFETTDAQVLGDTVMREAGNLQITVRGEGRETRVVAAKYVSLWLKDGDSWKLESAMWNGARGGGGQQQGSGRQRPGAGQGGGQGGAQQRAGGRQGGGGPGGGGFGQGGGQPGGPGRGGPGRGGPGGGPGGRQGGGGGPGGGRQGGGGGRQGGGARRGGGGGLGPQEPPND